MELSQPSVERVVNFVQLVRGSPCCALHMYLSCSTVSVFLIADFLMLSILQEASLVSGTSFMY